MFTYNIVGRSVEILCVTALDANLSYMPVSQCARPEQSDGNQLAMALTKALGEQEVHNFCKLRHAHM